MFTQQRSERPGTCFACSGALSGRPVPSISPASKCTHVHQGGEAGAVHVGVQEAHFRPLRRQRIRQVHRHRALPHATLAAADAHHVPHGLEPRGRRAPSTAGGGGDTASQQGRPLALLLLSLERPLPSGPARLDPRGGRSDPRQGAHGALALRGEIGAPREGQRRNAEGEGHRRRRRRRRLLLLASLTAAVICFSSFRVFFCCWPDREGIRLFNTRRPGSGSTQEEVPGGREGRGRDPSVDTARSERGERLRE